MSKMQWLNYGGVNLSIMYELKGLSGLTGAGTNSLPSSNFRGAACNFHISCVGSFQRSEKSTPQFCLPGCTAFNTDMIGMHRNPFGPQLFRDCPILQAEWVKLLRA